MPQTKEEKVTTLYHPAGFKVEVRGEARADVLRSRGYTDSKSGSDVRAETVSNWRENHENARYGMVDAYPQPSDPEEQRKHRGARVAANRERADAERDRDLERIQRENLPGDERARLRDAERAKEGRPATLQEPVEQPRINADGTTEAPKKAGRPRKSTKRKSTKKA